MLKLFRSLFLLFVAIGSLVFGPVTPVYAIAIPAEINKQFTPLQIDTGGVSVLRISIFNPNTFPLTNVAFVDNLLRVQPGLFVANPAGIVNTCGGTVSAIPNATTITLSSGSVPAQVGALPGQCYIEVNISSTVSGNLINTIPAHNPPTDTGLTADGDDAGTPVTVFNTTPASATLTVLAVVPPSLSKGFSPNTIWVGDVSELTITINNNDADTNLTQTSFTDTLPANLILANPVNGTLTNCGGTATLTAVAGGNTVTLNNGTVTPSQNCIVRVNVTSGIHGTYPNTIPAGPGVPGSIVTQQGVTNASPASAQLNIQPVGIIKAFSPTSIPAGGTSTLTITLQNPTGSAYTGANLTDNLPAGLTVTGVPATTCGGTLSNTATSVTLAGGTIPASASPPTPVGTCTITVTVTAPATAGTSTQTNTIPAGSLTTTQGITNPSPATADLSVQAGLTVLKAYSPTTISVGGTSTVTVTLRNHTASAFTGVNLTDVLPTNLTVVGTPVSPQCGGTITNTANSVTLTGGTIPSGTVATPGTCTITFQVTSLVPGSGTTYENTIPAGSVTTDQGVGNVTNTATGTDLTVVAAGGPVGLSKAFQTNPISPGQTSRLRITITAPVDTGLTGISIVDNLPAGLVIAASPAPTHSCTPGGTLTAPAGGTTITFTGGTRAANTSCNIDVWVTSTTPNTYVNSLPPNSITTNEGRTNTNTANATLRITSLSTSKAFYPPSVAPNGLSTLTITLTNTTSSPLINVSVTDDLATMGGTVPTSGVYIAAVPNASTTCGGAVTAVAGSRLITLTGGIIPAQVGGVPGICTINVDVQGRGGSTTRTNTLPIANVSGTVQTTGVVITPLAAATAQLTIADLGIGVVKGFDPVLVYGGASSTMTVQLINPNNTPLTGIAFTDDMALIDSGIVLANPINFNTGTCGGVLTGNPGDSSFSFSGGMLPANTSCFLTLSVVMEVNGNRTNRIPAGAVTTFNGVSSPDPTEASLTNLPGASVNKVFNPNPVLVGELSTLTITITNTSNIPIVNMELNDNLPGNLPTGLEVANPANLSNNCGGTVTANPGDQIISLVGGGLAGNASCSITVSVTSTEAGIYVNTIPPGALTADGGVTNNNPTTDTLVVNASVFSLGNRVWFDTDNSSTINGAEVGINGVTVQLYEADVSGNPTGGVIASQVTANGGYYRFDNLPAGDYVVVIPSTQFASGAPLAGYLSSGTTLSGAGVITETPAPDPDNDVDNDDNGTRQTAGAFNGSVISSAVTLGPSSNEPTNDTNADPTNPAGEAPNNQSNRTVDFGFYRMELGDQIFVDVNNNGTYDAGDLPLTGATVQLYSSNGTEINVGPDGILGTADDAPGGVTTGAGGTYLFSGMPQGDYIVRVTPPPGYTSTVDTFDPVDTTDPNTNTNNNDNGIGQSGGTVSSNIVTLTPGNIGAALNNIITGATGTTYNPTVDFGFTAPLFSLGNRVWFDTDNSSTINGSEVGVDNVTVQLYVADAGGNPTGGVLATQTTANGGYYRFDNLPAGDYVVVIPSTQLASGGPLNGYWSSGTTLSGAGAVTETNAPDPDNNVDSDDNGTLQTAGTFNGSVISSAVTLGPTANEPINDTDADPTNPPGEAPNAQSNLTLDFGFYRVELGNLVYIDVNSNGTFDAGDTPLAGATVQLYSSNGTEINVGPDGIFGTADDAPGGITTGAGGTYLFSNLPQGDYVVRVTPPVGYASTVDTADNADTTSPNTNTDNNDNGVGEGIGQVSSNPVSLTPGSVGAASNNTVNNTNGTTTNPTVDFGFRTNNGLAKTIIDTNETFTTGNDVAIGEIVTYQVTIDLPIGVALTNVTVTDQMDKGLAFVDCLSVVLGGVDITNPVCTPPAPAVSSITDPGDPAGNPANPGRQVVFTIGDIPAPTSTTTLVIQYRAIVLDVIENQDGDSLNNNVTWAWTGGSFSTSAPNVNIVEPDLAIDKSATPTNNVALGTPVQFTLFIDHTTPQSTADAFDVIVTDILPATLEYVQCTVQYTAGLAPDTPAATYCNPGATTTDLIFDWAVFPLGATSTITFNARLIGAPAINTASVAWTSLPIDPGLGGLPVQLSAHNVTSTERWYDPLDPVNIYSVSDSIAINAPAVVIPNDDDADLPATLPLTGFAPNIVTNLPEQPAEKAYTATDVWLEIPSLRVTMPIVGVPLLDEDWDVSWLWNQAGWLEGTAFPGWLGNSGLTSHVTLPNGQEGPFAKLGNLKWGDRIIVHAYGTVYTYEVRTNSTISPYNMTVLKHEEDAWLTLVTCKNYNEATDSYANRIAVRAVLIKVTEDTTPYISSNLR